VIAAEQTPRDLRACSLQEILAREESLDAGLQMRLGLFPARQTRQRLTPHPLSHPFTLDATHLFPGELNSRLRPGQRFFHPASRQQECGGHRLQDILAHDALTQSLAGSLRACHTLHSLLVLSQQALSPATEAISPIHQEPVAQLLRLFYDLIIFFQHPGRIIAVQVDDAEEVARHDTTSTLHLICAACTLHGALSLSHPRSNVSTCSQCYPQVAQGIGPVQPTSRSFQDGNNGGQQPFDRPKLPLERQYSAELERGERHQLFVPQFLSLYQHALCILACLAHSVACAVDNPSPIMDMSEPPPVGIGQPSCQVLRFGQPLKRSLHVHGHPGDLDQFEDRLDPQTSRVRRISELRERFQRLAIVQVRFCIGQQAHSLISCCEAEANGLLGQSCLQGVMSQLCCWSAQRLEYRECTAMQQASLGFAHLRSDHLTHLVVAKEIASHRGMRPPAISFAGLTQQSMSQDLRKRRQGFTFLQIGDPAEQVKGGSLPKDGTSPDQGTSRRREQLQLRQDESSHVRRKHTMLLRRLQGSHVEIQLICTRRAFQREDLALQQDAQGFHQVERLPTGFAKEPLTEIGEAIQVPGVHGLVCSNGAKQVQRLVLGQGTKGEIRHGQSSVQARKPAGEGIDRRQGFGAR